MTSPIRPVSDEHKHEPSADEARRDELLALAVQCETAEGVDLDIDHAIHDLIGDNDGAPAYTASLDAALTLVPEGWMASLDVLPGGRGAVVLFPPEGGVGEYATKARASTPALALTAACLRALAAHTEQGDG